jgi:hypothetical protein
VARTNRDPGEGFRKSDIYEVWGDVVEHAGDAGSAVIDGVQAALAGYFECQLCCARNDGHPFLSVTWGDMMADVDARAFGEHLDVYAILALRRGLFDGSDPATRIAELEGWERRDLQVFQTVLKRAIEEALEALDEGCFAGD